MAGPSSVGVTPGSPALMDCYQVAGGTQVQTVREHPASAVTGPASWTVAVAGAASVVAPDASRRCLILTNKGTANVYIRYDGTGPGISQNGWHDLLVAGARLVVEKELAPFAVSMIGDVANGYVEITMATAP